MQGNIHTQTIDGAAVHLYLPPQTEWSDPLPCLYVAGQEQPAQSKQQLLQIMQILEPQLCRNALPPFALASVSPAQWDAAYSPWPAAMGERSFSGKADDYFSFLHTRVHPYLKTHYGCSDAREAIGFIGYSLAGVAALYAYLAHPFFRLCASVSGSLWYPEWIPYLNQSYHQALPGKIYLSLGKAEVKTRSPLLRENQPCTEQTAVLLSEILGDTNVCFAWNNGNHFYEIPERHARAISWLLQDFRLL